MKNLLLLIALASGLAHAQTRTMKLDADCVKIQDGTCIDKTELGYLDGATANIQYQLDQLSGNITTASGDLTTHEADTSTHGVSSSILGETEAATPTNKYIDADTNTLVNIENADIKAAAAIDATKIADGSVSNTELQYLDGATANIQYQLDQLTTNSALDSGVVHTAGDESVAGVKTFTGKLVTSSTSNGSIPCPVMTGVQRDAIASPANGDCVYNSTTKALNVYDSVGIAWGAVGGGAGDVVGPSSSVDSEVALFDSTTGKLLKRASGTGFAKLASGVLSASSTVNAATELTGVAPVANGGTGASTLTANNVLLGNGTSAVQFVAPGSTGNVLRSNGTTWAASNVMVATPGATLPQILSADVGATGTVSGEIGDLFNGNCTNPSTGEKTCTINSGFTGINCVVSALAVGFDRCVNISSQTTTEIQLRSYNCSTNTAANYAAKVICHGY